MQHTALRCTLTLQMDCIWIMTHHDSVSTVGIPSQIADTLVIHIHTGQISQSLWAAAAS